MFKIENTQILIVILLNHIMKVLKKVIKPNKAVKTLMLVSQMMMICLLTVMVIFLKENKNLIKVDFLMKVTQAVKEDQILF